MQKPQITDIKVRMDCNGCVHKIKKALSGINGIYDLYIDFPQQKITVIGCADQEKIVKAIKKTRKTATICSLAEPLESSPYQQTEPPDPAQQPPTEAAPPDETPPPQAEPPQEEDTAPPPPEATIPTDNNRRQKYSENNILGTKDVGHVHEIHQYPPCYANRYDNSTIYSQETSSSMYMPHSYYNTYKPSPYYVREYEYVRSPTRHSYRHNGDYQSANSNITSIFSDENPNACRMI